MMMMKLVPIYDIIIIRFMFDFSRFDHAVCNIDHGAEVPLDELMASWINSSW